MPEFTNPLHQIIHDQIVHPALSSKKNMVSGTILNYDNITNSAVVEVPSRNSQQYNVLTAVPVQLTGGLKMAGPFKGDYVWVEFVDGNIHQPRIVAFADENFTTNTREKRYTHKTKGAYIPDSLCRR